MDAKKIKAFAEKLSSLEAEWEELKKDVEKSFADLHAGLSKADPAASPRLRLAPDRFRLTYFAARGRLNILDMETGDQWNVTKSGLSVEGDDKGHVSSMPIGETGFTITTSPKCIVLRDDRCGYEFTIMF